MATTDDPRGGMFPDFSGMQADLDAKFDQLIGLLTRLLDEVAGLRGDFAPPTSGNP